MRHYGYLYFRKRDAAAARRELFADRILWLFKLAVGAAFLAAALIGARLFLFV